MIRLVRRAANENMCLQGVRESRRWFAIKRARLVPACVGVVLHVQHAHVGWWMGWLELLFSCLFVLLILIDYCSPARIAAVAPSLVAAVAAAGRLPARVAPHARVWDEERLVLAACACVMITTDGMQHACTWA